MIRLHLVFKSYVTTFREVLLLELVLQVICHRFFFNSALKVCLCFTKLNKNNHEKSPLLPHINKLPASYKHKIEIVMNVKRTTTYGIEASYGQTFVEDRF